MSFLDWVITLGGAATAITAIWLLVKKVFRPLLQGAKTLIALPEIIKELQEHSRENYLSLLRLTVMSRDMPHGERVIAADKYIKGGGNGEVKKFAINELNINEIHHHE